MQMTREEACARAGELFRMGYNCAQAVCGTFAQTVGVDLQTAMRASAPFGGGFGRMREVCGAVSGMCLILGWSEPAYEPGDNRGKSEIYRKTQALIERFREENGSMICRELLAGVRVTPGTDAEERTDEYYRKRPCAMIVQDAAGLVWDMLQEQERERS